MRKTAKLYDGRRISHCIAARGAVKGIVTHQDVGQPTSLGKRLPLAAEWEETPDLSVHKNAQM